MRQMSPLRVGALRACGSSTPDACGSLRIVDVMVVDEQYDMLVHCRRAVILRIPRKEALAMRHLWFLQRPNSHPTLTHASFLVP